MTQIDPMRRDTEQPGQPEPGDVPEYTRMTEFSNKEADLRMAAATFHLCGSHPYLASALWAITRVVTPGIGTLAVDTAWRLYFDPVTVTGLTVPELSAVVYHETCHLLRDHAGRRPADTSALAWNVCADAEINDGLRKECQPLPGGAIFPSNLNAPDGLLAEGYLPYLPNLRQSSGREGGGERLLRQDGGRERQRQTGRNDEPAPGHVSGEALEQLLSVHQGAMPHKHSRQTSPCAGRCGSGAGGPVERWEISTAESGSATGLARAEAELVRRQTAQAIEEHVREHGKVPGCWQRWAKERLEPQLDWRREIAALVRGALVDVAGAADYSYKRPSRRQSCLGTIVVPCLRQPIPRVAVIVDTSGSITDSLLDIAVAEVTGILQAAGQGEGVTVLTVDAAVQSAQRMFRVEKISLAGGGGTDMGVGLAAAALLNPRPDIAIVITDGYTPWPEMPPRGLRTIVVLTGDGCAPAWAKAVCLPLDD